MTDWRGWLITDEQAELIRGGDIPARNAFYFDNLARIRRMARGYIYRRKFTPNWCEFNLDDCVNGLYLDLPFFDLVGGGIFQSLTESCLIKSISANGFIYLINLFNIVAVRVIERMTVCPFLTR